MHVFMIIEESEEVGDLLVIRFGQFGKALRHVANLRGDDVPAGILETLGDVGEILNLGEEPRALLAFRRFLGFERFDLLRAGLDGVAFGITIGVSVRGFDDAEMIEDYIRYMLFLRASFRF